MSERLLLSVTGLLGAGKTELTSRLVSEHGFESRNIGDELARIHRSQLGLADNIAISGLQRMQTHKQIRKREPDYFARFITGGEYTRRVVDGLRNYHDAQRFVQAGGLVVALVAPQEVRFNRRNGLDPIKDPSPEDMLKRELLELNDPDVHGSQALRVMSLANNHGFFVDATQSVDEVYHEVSTRLNLV